MFTDPVFIFIFSLNLKLVKGAGSTALELSHFILSHLPGLAAQTHTASAIGKNFHKLAGQA